MNKKAIAIFVLVCAAIGAAFYWFYYVPYYSVITYKGDYPDVVAVELDKGFEGTYRVEAIEGQVCVWFNEGVSSVDARKQIDHVGVKVLAQIPKNGYYLVEVPAAEVSSYIVRLSCMQGVDRVYPNMVSQERAVANYVLDNFFPQTQRTDTTSHGTVVKYAMEGCGAIKAFNIGYANTPQVCVGKSKGDVCINTEYFALDTIAQHNDEGPILINMSYGPGLPKHIDKEGNEVGYYWDDANDEERQDYRESVVNSVKNTIRNLRPLKDKDYVVVIAAGNEGVKEYNKEVISYLREHLTTAETEVLDKHFLFVTADETQRVRRHYAEYKNNNDMIWRNPDMADYYRRKKKEEWDLYNKSKRYSNEMERGQYDPIVTSVDVSDFEYGGVERRGTSFAAPRAVCMLSAVAEAENLTGAEVLALAKRVTLQNKRLTKEALQKEARENRPSADEQIEPTEPAEETVASNSNTPAVMPSKGWKPINTNREENNESYSSTRDDGDDDWSDDVDNTSIEDVVRRFGIALATEDLETLKKVTTDNFYRELKASYPIGRRMVSKKQKAMVRKAFNQLQIKVKETENGEVIAMLMGRGRHSDYYLCYQDGWKICDYGKNGVPVLKSKQLR